MARKVFIEPEDHELVQSGDEELYDDWRKCLPPFGIKQDPMTYYRRPLNPNGELVYIALPQGTVYEPEKGDMYVNGCTHLRPINL